MAEEREDNKSTNGKDNVTSSSYCEHGAWHKNTKLDSPTVTTTLKNLSALYRRQGKYQAADILEECTSQNRKEVTF